MVNFVDLRATTSTRVSSSPFSNKSAWDPGLTTGGAQFDIEKFVDELEHEQVEWMSSAPAHVQEVYKQGTSKFAVKLLAFAHLLYLLEFPEWQDLVSELFWGFKLLGPLPPGSEWLLRQDSKYSSPWSKEQFVSFNRAHASRLLSSSKVDEHSVAIKKEVLAEKEKARFAGPFPDEWLRRRSSEQQVFVAKAFPVVQGDKVRRADDWLRSGHNATVWASDCPPYQGTPTVASSVRRAAKTSLDRRCRRSTTKVPTGTSPFTTRRSARRCYRRKETSESGLTKYFLLDPRDPFGDIFVSLMQCASCQFRSSTSPPLISWTISTSASLRRQPNLRSRPFRSSTASSAPRCRRRRPNPQPSHRHCWESIGRLRKSTCSPRQVRVASTSCPHRSAKY